MIISYMKGKKWGQILHRDSFVIDKDLIPKICGEEIRTVKRLLRAENNDREALYKELAVANKIDSADIDKINTIFAKTRKQKAKPGHWHQDEKGKWTQKK